ncbi:MAG: hypothetical protein COT00_01580, partial [Candidatus Omnitrophica bacterium CG07_land_8_20_14_0_80_50_8]
ETTDAAGQKGLYYLQYLFMNSQFDPATFEQNILRIMPLFEALKGHEAQIREIYGIPIEDQNLSNADYLTFLISIVTQKDYDSVHNFGASSADLFVRRLELACFIHEEIFKNKSRPEFGGYVTDFGLDEFAGVYKKNVSKIRIGGRSLTNVTLGSNYTKDHRDHGDTDRAYRDFVFRLVDSGYNSLRHMADTDTFRIVHPADGAVSPTDMTIAGNPAMEGHWRDFAVWTVETHRKFEELCSVQARFEDGDLFEIWIDELKASYPVGEAPQAGTIANELMSLVEARADMYAHGALIYDFVKKTWSRVPLSTTLTPEEMLKNDIKLLRKRREMKKDHEAACATFESGLRAIGFTTFQIEDIYNQIADELVNGQLQLAKDGTYTRMQVYEVPDWDRFFMDYLNGIRRTQQLTETKDYQAVKELVIEIYHLKDDPEVDQKAATVINGMLRSFAILDPITMQWVPFRPAATQPSPEDLSWILQTLKKYQELVNTPGYEDFYKGLVQSLQGIAMRSEAAQAQLKGKTAEEQAREIDAMATNVMMSMAHNLVTGVQTTTHPLTGQWVDLDMTIPRAVPTAGQIAHGAVGPLTRDLWPTYLVRVRNIFARIPKIVGSPDYSRLRSVLARQAGLEPNSANPDVQVRINVLVAGFINSQVNGQYRVDDLTGGWDEAAPEGKSLNTVIDEMEKDLYLRSILGSVEAENLKEALALNAHLPAAGDSDRTTADKKEALLGSFLHEINFGRKYYDLATRSWQIAPAPVMDKNGVFDETLFRNYIKQQKEFLYFKFKIFSKEEADGQRVWDEGNYRLWIDAIKDTYRLRGEIEANAKASSILGSFLIKTMNGKEFRVIGGRIYQIHGNQATLILAGGDGQVSSRTYSWDGTNIGRDVLGFTVDHILTLTVNGKTETYSTYFQYSGDPDKTDFGRAPPLKIGVIDPASPTGEDLYSISYDKKKGVYSVVTDSLKDKKSHVAWRIDIDLATKTANVTDQVAAHVTLMWESELD